MTTASSCLVNVEQTLLGLERKTEMVDLFKRPFGFLQFISHYELNVHLAIFTKYESGSAEGGDWGYSKQ